MRRFSFAMGIFFALLVAGCASGAGAPAAAPAPQSGAQAAQPKPAAPKDLVVVRRGALVNLSDAVFLGRDWGAKYGLKVTAEIFPQTLPAMEAMLADQIDITNSGSASLATLVANQGEKIYIVGGYRIGGDGNALAVKKGAPYKSLADLKGKKIGSRPGSGAHQCFLAYMAKQGFTEKDFQLVNMLPPDMVPAIDQGQIEAMVAWEPTIDVVADQGLVTRLTGFGEVCADASVWVTKREFAQKHEDALVRYLAVAIEVADVMKNKPEDAAKIATKWLEEQGVKSSEKALTSAFPRRSSDPAGITPEVLAEQEKLSKDMLDGGRLKKMPDYQAVINLSYLDKAHKLVQSTK